jgi:DNA-binding GntR family transcriptional regulator
MPARKRTRLADTLATQIAEELRSGRYRVGDHLSAQSLADRFGVSRSPVSDALRELASRGLVGHQPQRGYFVEPPSENSTKLTGPPSDPIREAYLALADDRLKRRIPEVVSVNLLRDRYRLTLGQVQSLVTRIVKEGWLERRAGYGLQFTTMLDSTDALLQTYRFRISMEPAALMEPGYGLDKEGTQRCRRTEEILLASGTGDMSVEDFYDRGVRFHELIVAGSKNPFFLDALRRINSIRQLIAYHSPGIQGCRYEQAQDHLEILDLLEAGRNEEASWRLRIHLGNVIHALAAFEAL